MKINYKHMKKSFILLFLFSIIMSQSMFAQTEKYQALFMYNFTKYIEWPSEASSDEFIIGVVGNSSIISQLKSLAENKLVGNKKIVIHQYSNVENIRNCQIMFVSANKTSKMDQILTKISGQSTLIVTSKNGAIMKGSCINFVIKDGKQKFEISTKNINKKGLKVNTVLVNLGISVS